ncbi:hypothetical protein P389DRAFT_208893 [Cystobasidium minutum MCA 4210]|uniref:uncharacterized protein n=1 Tax=Cystobasidium minutum MCA 4210 TaxID=1397322 RepID=UPI0034CF6656|eukprot:jgi/Rhomi1/208893/estExt_Genemark1.C_2_t20152
MPSSAGAADEGRLPTCLILGGILEGFAAALLLHLHGSKKTQKKASYIRIVDKFLILPQSDTYLKWVHPEARKVLKEGYEHKAVEYVQANIAIPETRTKVFKAPIASGTEDRAFDIVFDFTAGNVTSGSTEEVMVQTAAKQAKLLGLEALKYGGVGAYVRMVDPFVTQPRKKCPLREDDVNAKPTSLWSKWHWEGSRALADLKDLNIVLARIANPWGPASLIGVTRRLTIASVYAYLGPSETLEFLWGKELTLEHVHMADLASAFYELAQWMRLGAGSRAKADELAGEDLPGARPAAVPKDEDGQAEGQFDDIEIEGLVERERLVRAPLFNVTDGSGQTQEDIGKIIAKALGIKVDYYSAITNTLAKMNMTEVVEAADEKHTEPWLEMLSASRTPVSNTPLSPILPPQILRKNRCHLDGSKMNRLIPAWRPKYPKITVDEVKECIVVWKKDGIWPDVKPKKK